MSTTREMRGTHPHPLAVGVDERNEDDEVSHVAYEQRLDVSSRYRCTARWEVLEMKPTSEGNSP